MTQVWQQKGGHDLADFVRGGGFDRSPTDTHTYCLLTCIERLEYFKQYTCTLFNFHLHHQVVLQHSHVVWQQLQLTFYNEK